MLLIHECLRTNKIPPGCPSHATQLGMARHAEKPEGLASLLHGREKVE